MYRRELGEPQLTFNYVKALSDFITIFCFGKGCEFHSPEMTSVIVPPILKRVWEVDNNKQSVMWEMGQLGGVSGDVFVKVAYEEPFVDPTGLLHPGRVRVLPQNPAFCFPEFHPHDRSRLIRFKLKYKFWGTALDGTRQVLTYTEVLTETAIEEYINDELIRSDPNTLGRIPIVHIPNFPVASSPWGLSDIQDIISLNREYNEKATEISDIINYHGSPVTVITGAKASNLEKGPKKVWSIGSKDAKIQNLTMDTNFAGILGYMELLKVAMHEMTGVPQSALGQMQPISNTSGTALSVQYQPLMNRYHLKQIQYNRGLEQINELIMLTLVLKEPEALLYNPVLAGVTPKPDQLLQLDPADPVTYRTSCIWSSPLPLDALVKINEIQAKMALGLESKRGALRDLGEQFPDQKMQEIFEELMEDTKEQGSLDLMRAQISQIQMATTGLMPDGTPLMMADGSPGTAPIDTNLAAEMMNRAFGIQPPQTLDYDNNSGA